MLYVVDEIHFIAILVGSLPLTIAQFDADFTDFAEDSDAALPFNA